MTELEKPSGRIFKFKVGDVIMREPLLGNKLFWWSIVLGRFYKTNKGKNKVGYLIVTTLGGLKFDTFSVVAEENIFKGIPPIYLTNENFVTDIAGFIFAKNKILKDLKNEELAMQNAKEDIKENTKREIIWSIYEDDLLKHRSPKDTKHLEIMSIDTLFLED